MKNFLIGLCNKEHRGAVAIETTILTPLMFSTCLMLLYFFFVGCAYVTYCNLANTIAMELNSRTTGAVYSAPAPDIWTYSTLSNSSDGSGYFISKDNIIFYNGYLRSYASTPNLDSDGTLRPSGLYILNKYKNGFAIPFNEVKSITISSSQRLKSSDAGRGHVGTVITVQINFKTTLFGDLLSPIMEAHGYSIII